MNGLKYWIKKNFVTWLYRRKAGKKTTEKIAALQLKYRSQSITNLSDASFDIFTYHGEDGILLYMLEKIKNAPKFFIDIGAGDCIKGNCANLAIHLGWSGIFVDNNENQLAIGRNFYKNKLPGQDLFFINETVTPANINAVIDQKINGKKIGVLSMDIDGNDYWLWKAVEHIQPEIVLIEVKVEFAARDIIVPFSEMNHGDVDRMYNGASIEAFRKLGLSKGYKLVGANKYGYNLFFVKKDQGGFTAVTTADILKLSDCAGSFYPDVFFEQHKFVTE